MVRATLASQQQKLSRAMEHTALIYVMVLMSAADSDMTDRELFTMGEIVRTLPIFRDYNADLLPKAAEDCAEMLAQSGGLDAVIAHERSRSASNIVTSPIPVIAETPLRIASPSRP